MNRLRAFIALNVPVTTLDAIIELERSLSEAARKAGAQIAWVPPARIHITLKYLGEIAPENTLALRDAIFQMSRDYEAPTIEAGTCGVFPSTGTPRTLWLGINGCTALVAQINERLSDFGFAPDTQRFHGHLTLGRIDKLAGEVTDGAPTRDTPAEGADRLPPWVTQYFTKDIFVPVKASELVLYEVAMPRPGTEYQVLARANLGTSRTSTDRRDRSAGRMAG